MTTAAPTAMPITDQLETLLKTLDGVTYYRSEVDDHPPTLDGSNRVAPYVVLYPAPAKPGDPGQQTLAYSGADLDYGCQITCAAGFSVDAEFLADRVRALVEGWSPVLEDTAVGQMRPPVGFDPGFVQRSGPEVTPPRFWVPLQYRLTATTT